jgi:CHAT domain-containing protein/tetratricopeptide (TPR) repeat protein
MLRSPAARRRAVLAAGGALLAATGLFLAARRDDRPLLGPEEIRKLYFDDRHAEAEREARRLYRHARRAHGAVSRPAAEALSVLVRTCRAAGNDEDPGCLRRAERALEVWEQVVGPDHPDLVQPLRSIATIKIKATGERREVRGIIVRLLSLFERHFPSPSLEVMEARSWLANHRRNQWGDLAGARRILERSVAMGWELPPSRQLAGALHDLATTEAAMADFEPALAHCAESLAMVANVLGDEDPHVAVVLDTCGAIHQELGDFERAHDAFERGEAIRRAAVGADHMWLAASWKLRAELAERHGDDAAAAGHYRRALERVAGGWDPQRRPGFMLYFDRGREIALLAGRLARLAAAAGHRDEAEGRLAEAFAALAATGIHSPLPRAELLTARAEVRLAAGRHREAEEDYVAAARLYATRLGSDHPLHGRALLGVGRARLDSGGPADPGPPLRQAAAILEGALGPDHPLLAETLLALAASQRRAGRSDAAGELARRAAGIEIAHLETAALGLPERIALHYVERRLGGLDLVLGLAVDAGGSTDATRAWDLVARGRGVVLETVAQRQAAGEIPDAARDRLAAARRRLAHLQLAELSEQPFAARAELLAAAREEKERAERALAASGPRAGAPSAAPTVSTAALVRALPAGSALVAFVDYADIAPATGRRLAALVLGPGAGPPRLVPLGTVEEIAAGVDAWRAAALRVARAPALALSATREARAAGDAVRRLVWDPWAAEIAGSAFLLVVPEGPLNGLPLAALPSPGSSGTYLLETAPAILYLASERTLLAQPLPSAAPAAGVLLAMGDPVSGRGTSDTRAGRSADCATLAAGLRQPLPGAAREIAEVGRRWRANGGRSVLRSGRQATAAEFTRLAPGASVLHLATHGFFDPHGCLRSAPTGEPLLASGLVFAPGDGPDDAHDADDALLTAEEIAALDLGRARLVLLSACDSGGGESLRAEGVMGLRRGFLLAGAASLVMALLPLDDQAAADWVPAFYEHWLAGEDLAQAVHGASQERLADARRRGRAEDVRSWGAFVALGAPRVTTAALER